MQERNKIKIFNFILFIDLIIYVFSNVIIFRYSGSSIHNIWILSIRDSLLFLFSIVMYILFCNSFDYSILVFPKISNKIIKNSIIAGISIYFISISSNLIFTNIFKLTLKNTVYLNDVYDIYDFSFESIFYIIISTIFIELFFRVILNDAFNFLQYKLKLIVASIIYALFFFGLSRLFYGFILGVFLMHLFNLTRNINIIIISSIIANIFNQVVRILGKVFVVNKNSINMYLGDTSLFSNFILPIMVILVSFIFFCACVDNFKIRSRSLHKKEDKVIPVCFNRGIESIIDIYFMIFLLFSIFILILGYVFLG